MPGDELVRFRLECSTSMFEQSMDTVFLQDQNFRGSLMTPCLKIWGSLANLEGQNFFIYYNNFYLSAHA